MNRRDFQSLALERLEDAQVLLIAKRYGSAYYLAGYAVECALKACIARQTKRHDFPPNDTTRSHYTHKLQVLLTTAGLSTELQNQERKGKEFRANWAIVKDWNSEGRYRRQSRHQAEQLLAAIMDDHNGVLQWLKTYW